MPSRTLTELFANLGLRVKVQDHREYKLGASDAGTHHASLHTAVSSEKLDIRLHVIDSMRKEEVFSCLFRFIYRLGGCVR